MPEVVRKTQEELNECIRKQKELCAKKDYPDFAPHNGLCWKCNRNIYQNYQIGDRISNGESGERLITGCPHCYRSYCD